MATYTDIARRVYNHTFKLDPIIRSLLDTDFYKLLMLQMIWGLYPKVEATFSLINRTRSVRLAEEIDIDELRAQLDHCRTLRFSKKEMIWLAGNTFYGSRQIFQPGFLRWLEHFQLPESSLEKRDGQFVLEFPGLWVETTMWEIPALAIINELRSRAALKHYGPFALDVLQRNGHDILALRSKHISEFQQPGAVEMNFVFTVCDTAAAEECPSWPGRPITGHWGLPDPVKVQGTESEKALAFARTYGALRRRIAIFTARPFAALDRLALQGRVDRIATEAATSDEV